MVKYTGRNGKEYILRFDMSAIEAIADRFGGVQEGLDKLSVRAADTVRDVFLILAQAGMEYMAEKEGRICNEQVSGEGLLSKHSSIGRLNGMMIAIREAIADGNRMQSKDEEDDQIRDGYLAELNEKEKN